MLKFRLLGIMLAGLLLISACGSPQKNSGASGAQDGKGTPQAGQKAGAGQDEWAQLKEAAKKEGQVVVATSLAGNAITAMQKEWSKQNFGVDLKIMPIKGAQLIEKLKSERKSALYTLDSIIFGPGSLVNEVKPMGAIDPIDDKVLVLPGVKEPSNWQDNKIYYVDKEKQILQTHLSPKEALVINTSLLKPETIQSYQDLLKPEYKGKIVMNEPRMSGAGLKWFHAMLTSGKLDKAFFGKLKDQLAPITKDEVLQAQGIAQGKYMIGIGMNDVEVNKLIKAGAPLAFLTPKEGTFLLAGSGQITLVNKAPHPNASKLFVNWFLTKDMQSIISPIIGRQSLRVDVSTDGLSPGAIRKPGSKDFNADTEEALKAEPASKVVAEEIFGTLK